MTKSLDSIKNSTLSKISSTLVSETIVNIGGYINLMTSLLCDPTRFLARDGIANPSAVQFE